MATVLIAGGSGLIGTRLSQLLRKEGYEVLHLSRRKRPEAEFETFQWDIERGQVDQEAIERADYVINLAGAGIADQRWTEQRKQVIIDSRVGTARLLKQGIERSGKKPAAYLSSAAIGIYGDRGDAVMDEESTHGDGFLTESCEAWEAAVDEVRAAGIRTVTFRIGIVLSTKDGALPRLLKPMDFFVDFFLGGSGLPRPMEPLNYLVAPYFGNGRHWYSWIHIDDVCRAFLYALEKEKLSGTFNLVAPDPVRNKELMQRLVAVREKQSLLLPVPAIAMRLVLGEMAHTVLDSTRVSSEKLEETGFRFEFSKLQPALADLLERKI